MEENQPLRPRFKIQKRRISDDEKEETQEEMFVPEKVIYVEIDDEITIVFDKVKKLRTKKIALVIPKRAKLFGSLVNLKILKKKCDDLGKEVAVVTSDVSGIAAAEKVGFPVAHRIFEKEMNFHETAKPVPVSSSQRPVRLHGEKVSITEVIQRDTSSFFSRIANKLRERIRKKKQKAQHMKLVFVAPNKQALFTLILVSVLLLLAIAYIALPGATVYLTPRSSILDPSFNVTFLDYEKNRNRLEQERESGIAIASYPIAPAPLTKKFIHRTTGKIFKGENARGAITVINMSTAPWALVARTRFQTEEGLIFRTPNAVTVPAAKGGIPGTLDVAVSADEFDAYGQVIGARGNIPGTKFFLPALKTEESRKKLYGESRGAMSGGTTETIASVREEDLEAAKEEVRREIQKIAPDDLKKYLEQYNLETRRNLSLLNDKNVILVSEPVVQIPGGLVQKPFEQFEMTATYSVAGIAFDRAELIAALKERLMAKVDPDKKIVKIDEEDLSYKFLDQDSSAGRVRVTVIMRAIQMYELDPEKENGHRFIKKVTDHILGTKVSDAIAYIQQQTDEIARVEINTWPVWAPTIPNIADNIKFVIKDDEEMVE